MDSSHSLGAAIKAARKRARLTQDDLSDRAGLAYSTLAKIEQGAIKSPSIFTIQSLAKALDVGLDELLGPQSSGPVTEEHSDDPITFVYFDMNGVFVRFFHKAFAHLAAETGVAVSKIETTFWHYNDAVNRGDISVDDYNESLAQILGVETVDWREHYMQAVEPITEMQDYLLLAKERYKVGLLTNTMPDFVRTMAERQLLPDLNLFDVIIDSSEIGSVKPEIKIYEAAEAACGVPPTEICFVDDSRANLSVAERRGWKVIWFDDYDPAESVRRIDETLHVKTGSRELI
jgi:HAD superfamily hydrolase (TIGR01509 family)